MDWTPLSSETTFFLMAPVRMAMLLRHEDQGFVVFQYSLDCKTAATMGISLIINKHHIIRPST